MEGLGGKRGCPPGEGLSGLIPCAQTKFQVAFDRRKAAEVRAERIDDVRRLMEL